ncbi:hypothetical protein EK21DRAFT_98200 [Setomelanomma holmii]|uniref:Rhodopsin domain-containing protein n=1 Tax=Setomelanomma holmii TaxID=210430 RepID=A0A9P4LQR1_9PLEO|nr:hypothetical protein EK21DRAFT_98200 [Setomelanomma holmii]
MLMPTQSPATVVGVTATMLAIDIAVVFLRILARRTRRQSLQADDCLSCYPAVSQAPSSSLQYVFLVLSVPTLGAIKASVLLFYRRIFVVDKTNLRNAQNLLYLSMLGVILLWTTGFLFAFMFACKGNFSAWWTSAISLIENCVDTLELFFSFAVADFVSDVLILVMPVPVATIASLIRMIWDIWARQVGFDVSLDQDLLITTSLFWNILEVSLGIIACCLPTLRGLAREPSVDSWVHNIRDQMSLRSGQSSARSESSMKMSDIDREELLTGVQFVVAVDHK